MDKAVVFIGGVIAGLLVATAGVYVLGQNEQRTVFGDEGSFYSSVKDRLGLPAEAAVGEVNEALGQPEDVTPREVFAKMRERRGDFDMTGRDRDRNGPFGVDAAAD